MQYVHYVFIIYMYTHTPHEYRLRTYTSTYRIPSKIIVKLSVISLPLLKVYANIAQQCYNKTMCNKTVPIQLAVNLTKNSALGIACNEVGINEHL